MGDHGAFLAVQRQRAATRHKLFEPIILRLRDGGVRAHMLDLSTTGALLHSTRPPLAGAQVRVESETFVAAARVIWVRAKRFGIRFETALSEISVDRALQLGATPI